jgi:hypothetical protein
MTQLSEEEVWAKVTHVQCFMCGTLSKIDWTMHDEDDLDDAYDVFQCCDDPSFEAIILSDKPLFENEEANDDAKIQENPVLGIYADQWKYHVAEDLITLVCGEPD